MPSITCPPVIGLLLALSLILMGCASAVNPPENGKPSGMNNVRLGQLLKSKLEDLDGELGFWTGKSGDHEIYVITDEKHNRMRVMTPVQKIDTTDAKLLATLLSANFDRALDARYAIKEGVLWAAFIHPLGSLTEEDLNSAIDQVRTLAENTGTTYSSSGLQFGGTVDNFDGG